MKYYNIISQINFIIYSFYKIIKQVGIFAYIILILYGVVLFFSDQVPQQIISFSYTVTIICFINLMLLILISRWKDNIAAVIKTTTKALLFCLFGIFSICVSKYAVIISIIAVMSLIFSHLSLKIHFHFTNIIKILPTAFHEAGHVLIACKLCPELIDHACVENIYVDNNKKVIQGYLSFKDFDMKRYWASMVPVGIAGELAEKMYFPSSKRNASTTDIDLLISALLCENSSIDYTKNYIQNEIKKVIELLSNNSKVIVQISLALGFFGYLNSRIINFFCKINSI